MKVTAVDTTNQTPQANKAVDKDKAAEFARLKKACEQFESIFISYMLKSMRAASEESDLFGDGLGGDMFTQMFDESLADKMAESSPFGIGDQLVKTYAKIAGLSDTEFKTYDAITDAPSYKRTYIKTKDNNSNQVISHDKINSYDNIIAEASQKHNIESALIKAVIMHESGGDTTAVSAKGAKGLMQLMDGTATMLGVEDPFDARQNILGGTKYLASLVKKFDGDYKKALAAYNAGPANVEKYNGVPPYKETEKYVIRVLESFEGSSNLTKSR